MPKIILKILFLCAFFRTGCSSTGLFSVDFFNVGQGNCTVVNFGKGLPPLLVDAGSSAADAFAIPTEPSSSSGAGSSSGPFTPGATASGHGGAGGSLGEDVSDEDLEESSFKKRKMSTIGGKLLDYMPMRAKPGNPHLNVVISHGDIDHCNWIVELIGHVSETKKIRVRALLGGSLSDYNVSQLEVVRKFAESARKDSPGEKVYVSEYGGEIPPFEYELPHYCSILAAEITTKNKNRHSIVLEVGSEGISVILTGDAPGQLINTILEPYEKDLGKNITIFQASHHGADSHDSNATRWFEMLRPHYCVISAGSRRDYGHPRQKMIRNALSSPNILENKETHLLSYYSDWSFIDSHEKLSDHITIGRLDSDFSVGLTRLGIYSTASQGDIHFTKEGFDFEKKFWIEGEPLTSLVLIRDFLTKSSLLSFKLPPVTFSSGDQFKTFIDTLIQNQPNLISCDLSRADLSSGEIEKLLDLIVALKEMTELDLPYKMVPDEGTKGRIIDAWTSNRKNPKNLRFIAY